MTDRAINAMERRNRLRVGTPIRGGRLDETPYRSCRQTEESPETPPPAEAALPAAEEAAPAVATAPAAPQVDSSTLPAEKRTSEETVRPDSETLFY